MSKATETSNTSDRELVTIRTFDAPRELVWKAWTDPEQVVHWWGPEGFTTTIEVMDVRVGGKWKHVMHGPDGTDYPNHSLFKEVVPPERLVYSHGGHKAGEKGVAFVNTVTFREVDGKTEVTMRAVFPSAEDRDRVIRDYNAAEGGKQTLGRLGEFLASRVKRGEQ